MASIADDLTKAEISFAQQLASGEPAVRSKALTKLRKWFKSTVSQKEVKKDDYMRLWKGLYYCMWMQDKPLQQEELADNICQLMDLCGSLDKVIEYQEAFYQTLASEWATIDKWRIDKFMMMVRRMLRFTFAYIRDHHEWSNDAIDKLIQSWRRTVLSTDPDWCIGLKMHFNSLILDEIDNSHSPGHPIPPEKVVQLLTPFFELLSDRQTSDRHFMSICSDILETILVAAQHDVQDFVKHPDAKKLQAIEQDESDESGDESLSASASSVSQADEDDGIKFNYQDIANRLFEVGSKKDLKSQRRKKLYTLTKRFEAASTGSDPFEDDEDEQIDSFAGDKDSVDMAARRLLRREDAARLASQTQAELDGRKSPTTPDIKKQQKQAKVRSHKSTDAGDSSDDIVAMSDKDSALDSDDEGSQQKVQFKQVTKKRKKKVSNKKRSSGAKKAKTSKKKTKSH